MTKYRVGQALRFNDSPSQYTVIKTPETCIHNNQPAYLLEHITLGSEIARFHRSQVDVELHWKPMEA